MKNALVILLCFCCSIILRAQNNISVTSFKLLPNDLTANTNGTEIKDQNGEKTALIKVVTTQTGFTFEGGALGITKVKQENGEVWVYVPQKSKKITIKHPRLGVLRDYYFPCAIEAARTYEMMLASGIVEIVVKKDVGGNFLTIEVQPENASVYIDGIFQQNVPKGEYSIFLGYGEHTYRIEAAGYSTQSGITNIGKEVTNLNVKLESALSSLSINCPTEGVQLFLNKKLKGVDKWSGTVSAGTYLIEAVKEGFRKSLENIEIGEKENRTISLPALLPICGTIKVNVKPIGSTIEIDGKMAGKTPAIINDVIIGRHTVKVTSVNGKHILKDVELKENEIYSIEDIIPDLTIYQLIELAKEAINNDDYEKAFEYVSKAEPSSNAEAQYIMGKYYHLYGNRHKELECYQKAADQGNVQAQFDLAKIYDYGIGVIANGKVALELYQKVAEQGYEDAQYRLGVYYEYGYNSVPKSAIKAEKWYILAAEHGNMEKQYELADKYMYGIGVTESASKAVMWYDLAAKQGHTMALYKLGYCYEYGYGVRQSDQEAIKYYKESIKKGYAKAEGDLIRIYSK